MQFASWNFVEVYIFLPTMNYSNQSKVLTSYSTVKKDVEEMENEESGKEIRIFVYVCMLCLKHSIRLIRYENDLQALSMCVCVCAIFTLYLLQWCFSYDYGHTSFHLWHSYCHDMYQCILCIFIISTSICDEQQWYHNNPLRLLH